MTAMGALLSVVCVTVCIVWSGEGSSRSRSSSLLQQQLGAYDSASKQKELAIIQRALSDELVHDIMLRFCSVERSSTPTAFG